MLLIAGGAAVFILARTSNQLDKESKEYAHEVIMTIVKNRDEKEAMKRLNTELKKISYGGRI